MVGDAELIAALTEWQQVLVVLLAAIFLAKAIQVITKEWIKRSERLAVTNLDRILISEIRSPLYLTVILGGVYASIVLVDVGPRIEFFAHGAMLTVLLVVWIRGGIRFGARTLQTFRENGREMEFAPVLKNLWSFFLLLGGLFILLSIWDIDITPLLASAGIIGIILGIAAQDSIGNLIAGMSLNLDKTFKNGDMIQLEDGTRGTVIDLSIRSTTIKTRDDITVTIPNSELNQTQVINESAPTRPRRIRLDVGVAYGSDLRTVESILMEVARAESLVLGSPEPRVRFREFADSSIVAQLQCHIEHPALYGRVQSALIVRIDEAFKQEGIKIPFPQRELTFFEAGNEIAVDAASQRQIDRIEPDE